MQVLDNEDHRLRRRERQKLGGQRLQRLAAVGFGAQGEWLRRLRERQREQQLGYRSERSATCWLDGTARPRSGIRFSPSANTGDPCMKTQSAVLPSLLRVIVGALVIAAWTVQPSAATELEGVHFADQYRSGT